MFPISAKVACLSIYIRKGCPLLNDAESNERSVVTDCDVRFDAPISFRRLCTQTYRESRSSVGCRDWKATEATLMSEMKLRILCTLSVNSVYCSFGNLPPHGMSYLIKAASLLMPDNSMLPSSMRRRISVCLKQSRSELSYAEVNYATV